MRERLIRLAHAIDAAMFVAALTAVLLWGWPTETWGQVWVISFLLPFVSWVVWAAYCRWWRDPRRVRQAMAYRREKFGGFVAVPRGPDGKPGTVPVERPD